MWFLKGRQTELTNISNVLLCLACASGGGGGGAGNIYHLDRRGGFREGEGYPFLLVIVNTVSVTLLCPTCCHGIF